MVGVDVVVILAVIAVGLFVAEMLLPTGGVLAVIGAAGLVASGIIAMEEDAGGSQVIGPALIAAGVLSLVTATIFGRKVLAAHRDEPVRTGWEELIGEVVEVRQPLDPQGQVWAGGALWQARVADGSARVDTGNRVRVQSVDGLTLVVEPEDKQS